MDMETLFTKRFIILCRDRQMLKKKKKKFFLNEPIA